MKFCAEKTKGILATAHIHKKPEPNIRFKNALVMGRDCEQ